MKDVKLKMRMRLDKEKLKNVKLEAKEIYDSK